MTSNDHNIDIIQWGLKYLTNHGYKLKSNYPEKVQDTPWSYVLRFATSSGYIYLKHTPKLIALEPVITKVLHDQFNAAVPEVVAQSNELSCFLMKDAGRPLRQMLKKKFEVELLCKGIRLFTSLQLNVVDHIDVLMNVGVPDWRLDKLSDLYKQLLSQKDILIADGLSENEMTELEIMLPEISNLCKKLSSYSIKQTIVQPDFHDNNLLIDDAGNITIIDLGEIVISHPFFSLINCLQQAKKHHALKNADEAYVMLMDACFENFMAYESKNHLLEAFVIAQTLLPVYGALANARLMNACGRDALMSIQPGRLSGELKALIVRLHSS